MPSETSTNKTASDDKESSGFLTRASSQETLRPDVASATFHLSNDASLTLPAIKHHLPDYEQSIYTCNSCQIARKDRQYQARVAMLFRPLYCSKCESDHAAIFFSYKERYTANNIRRCICYEGYQTICPHVQVSLSDIYHRQGEIERCREPGCVWHDVEVQFFDGMMTFFCKIFSSKKALSSNPPERDPSIGLQLLRSLHRDGQSVFCPHRMASPDPFSDEAMRQSTQAPWAPDLKTMACSAGCFEWVSYAEASNSNIVAACGGQVQDLDKGPLWHHRWQLHLDPASFGFFRDPETLNVVHCRDQKCSTTLGLIRFHMLKDIAVSEAEEGKKYSMKLASYYLGSLDISTLKQLEILGLA